MRWDVINRGFVQILRLGKQAGFSNCFVFFAKKRLAVIKCLRARQVSLISVLVVFLLYFF